MVEYKVRTVSGERKFQQLLNDMAQQGYRLVSFSYVGGVFNIMAVFVKGVKRATADVVEVVRCKDCILRNTDDCAMNYKCDCGSQYSWENDTDFCSWGKRSKLK